MEQESKRERALYGNPLQCREHVQLALIYIALASLHFLFKPKVIFIINDCNCNYNVIIVCIDCSPGPSTSLNTVYHTDCCACE